MGGFEADEVAGATGGLTVQSGTTSRLSSASSGTQTVTCTGTPKMIFIVVYNNSGDFSDGRFDGTANSCLGTNFSSLQLVFSLSISILGAGGWTGIINNLQDGSFDIVWTKVGLGLDVDVQYTILS